MTKYDINAIAKNFRIEGNLTGAEPFGSGIINDTFCLTTDRARYVLQRINHEIFTDPIGLMANVIKVTEHITGKLKQQADPLADRMLKVIATDDDTGCYKDPDGNYWRAYNLIEGAVTYDTIEQPQLAREAARMFGWFQRMLADLPGSQLCETIPGFHNTPKRFETFKKALEADACGRAKGITEEIDFALEHESICGKLLALADTGEIPIRVTHNDTKINNVMFDKETSKGVCVIDLDTVMPGLSLYDFGDMVRTATSFGDENQRDLSKVSMRMDMFEPLVRGFASETAGFMTEAEKANLVFAGKLITFEQYIRFLGDYIAGDVYYKIEYKTHNLDRSRTQMKLIQTIIDQEDAMHQLVESVWRQLG